jgi:glutaminase
MALTDYQPILDDINTQLRPLLGLQGKVATYIPALARVSPYQFGIALRTHSSVEASAGDATVPFSTQSVSKLFALTLTIQHLGDALLNRIHRAVMPDV